MLEIDNNEQPLHKQAVKIDAIDMGGWMCPCSEIRLKTKKQICWEYLNPETGKPISDKTLKAWLDKAKIPTGNFKILHAPTVMEIYKMLGQPDRFCKKVKPKN